ncbi:VOC family protein [Bounagaea algeriensis]
MYLENVIVDAVEPQRLGRFWEAVIGGQRLTDEPDIFETRIAVAGGPVLDVCFQRVGEPPSGAAATSPRPPRRGQPGRRGRAVARAGARHLDIRLGTGDDPGAVAAGITERGGHELHPDWGELPWRIYADPSGNELCVLPARS